MSASPPRSRNPTYLIIAGGIVSVLGALLVIVLVSSPGRISVVPGATRGVLVAAREVGAHAQIGADDLKLVQYPTDLVPDRVLNSVDQASGRFTVNAIPRGQPITQDLIAGTAQAAVSAGIVVPPGEVGVVIPPSDARNQVAGIVQNGDHLDVLVHNLPGQSSGQVATTFTDLPVQVLSGAGGAGAGQQWIVYMPLARAEQLTYLLLNGQYSFVVRARKDAPESPVAPVGRNEFNSTFGIH
ncbi:MAG TPA: SAF domain-containing protein [Candidatus Dormibacteraeota bacterium]|nr:SAF domain-containing protein [Candidatus Dormibacteraeota bacterium]